MLPDSSLLRSIQSRLTDDLFAFIPEILLAAVIVLVLAARLITAFDRIHRVSVAIVGVGVALAVTVFQATSGGCGGIFTGLLMIDDWAIAFRAFILLATLLVLLLSRLTGLPDSDDSGDYTVMLLGAAIGLMMMVSSNHLLMLFLAIEMASLPSYALAGFLKGRSKGSEAALKYVIYGAAASGIMLYGISLVCAQTHSGFLPVVMNSLSEHGFDLPVTAGCLFIGVGLGYKLSIVPFHVWLPDVFEGAPAEIGAFLSIASKAGAVGLVGRLLASLHPQTDLIVPLAILGAVTATFGNLMAYAQPNLKRLLGYSTIAHAGFLLAALAPVTLNSFAAVLIYLAAYLLANLGAFAAVAALRRMTGQENVASLAGLMKAAPALCVGFALCILSLLGLPPLAGFAGKFLVFESLWNVSPFTFTVLLVNTAIGAGYYLRLLRIAVFDDAKPEPKATVSPLSGLVLLMGVASVILGVLWNPLLVWASMTVKSSFLIVPIIGPGSSS